MTPSPEQVAAAARAVEGSFLERLAIHADALASGLARSHQLVAWDREQLIGATQSRVRRIAGQKLTVVRDLPSVRVLERRGQPLECVDIVWRHLRRGQRVFVEYEAGTCPAVLDLLRGIARALAPGSLAVAETPGADEADHGPRVGVDLPGPRVAMIDADADRELAAYVLARTSLRRSGSDPRAVKAAYVCGSTDLLQRHVRRLWVGVSIGPATDSGSFAGPIEAGVRDEFLAACERWAADESVEVWCEGAGLDRSGATECYAAPALFFVDGAVPKLPMVGPMLVIVGCDEAGAKAGYEAAVAAGGQAVQVGGRAGDYPGGNTRHIRGALLVERLPPGLPEPRPV